MKSLVRTLRRWTLAPILWWVRDEEADWLEQSAWSRGRADARRAAADGRVFGLFTAVSTVAAPIIVGAITGSLSSGVRALLTIASVIVGYLLVPTAWAVVATIVAPVTQRDELRARLRANTADDPQLLGDEFSAWLIGVRANLPAEPSFSYGAVFEERGGPMRADFEIRRARYTDACAESLRAARVGYNDQFRERVARALDPDLVPAIDNPQTLSDLDTIAEALAVAGHADEPVRFVPASHEQLLRATLEHLQIRLSQQKELDFGDPAGGAKLYESAFAAHFPQLLDRVEQWNSSVRAVKTAHTAYAKALAFEADRLDIDPPIYDRDTILRALAERTRPSLYLALEEWSPDSVPVRAYDDGSVEFAGIRTQVTNPVAPAHLQQLVARLPSCALTHVNFERSRPSLTRKTCLPA